MNHPATTTRPFRFDHRLVRLASVCICHGPCTLCYFHWPVILVPEPHSCALSFFRAVLLSSVLFLVSPIIHFVALQTLLFLDSLPSMPSPVHRPHAHTFHPSLHPSIAHTHSSQDISYKFDICFMVAFGLEMVLKQLALGPRLYFKSGWNWLDFIIVVVAAVGKSSSTRARQSQNLSQKRRMSESSATAYCDFDCDFNFSSREWSCSKRSHTRTTQHQTVKGFDISNVRQPDQSLLLMAWYCYAVSSFLPPCRLGPDGIPPSGAPIHPNTASVAATPRHFALGRDENRGERPDSVHPVHR